MENFKNILLHALSMLLAIVCLLGLSMLLIG